MKSYSDADLNDPELLMALRVLLLRQMATGAEMRIDGEMIDSPTIWRLVGRTQATELAQVCDYLIPLVLEDDRAKYGDLFALLLRPNAQIVCGANGVMQRLAARVELGGDHEPNN